MADPLWKTLPNAYARCERCRGTGDVACRWCDGNGSTVGPDWYLRGRTIGRRVGLKRCVYCHGRGTQRCGSCIAGSVPRPDTEQPKLSAIATRLPLRMTSEAETEPSDTTPGRRP